MLLKLKIVEKAHMLIVYSNGGPLRIFSKVGVCIRMLGDDIVREAVNSVELQTLIVVRAEIGEDCWQSKIIEM